MKRAGRLLGNLLAMLLALASVQAMGEAQLAGRDFNHMSTGFPLSGGHATAACEACHAGGVFKGTPKNCEGCHALGKRVVATPKSNRHIITNAPCESCHFNTSTFLGARFNHATARPEQCQSCHNNLVAMGKPASHGTGKKATDSCDHCHRTSSFIPASWNHIGVAPGTCTNCHVTGGQSSIAKPASHTSGSIKGMNQCDDCHSFTSWFPARFKHNTGAACSSCHNGVLATGKISGHLATTDECNQCHFSTFAWSPALGAKPANHIPYNTGVNCSNCHTGLAKVGVATLHANSVASYTCANCHISPTSPGNYLGNNQNTRKSHEGSSGNNCTGCHEHRGAGSYGSW